MANFSSNSETDQILGLSLQAILDEKKKIVL